MYDVNVKMINRNCAIDMVKTAKRYFSAFLSFLISCGMILVVRNWLTVGNSSVVTIKNICSDEALRLSIGNDLQKSEIMKMWK